MTSTAPPESLVALAHAHGVATEYWDWQGQQVTVSTDSIRAVLSAMDIACASDDDVTQSLADVDDDVWRATLPPTVVLREGWSPWVSVHLPHGSALRVEIELEDGEIRDVPLVDHWVEPRQVDGVLTGRATAQLPADLPLGWHRLTAFVAPQQDQPYTAESTVVVTPPQLTLPEGVAATPATGVQAQLYQVRSATSWGMGDLRDLSTLGRWAREDLGCDFVLINPLHAAEPVAPMEPSPYLPTTRRFVNPLYLHVEDIPELRLLAPENAQRVEDLAARAQELNGGDLIDRDAAWALKRQALELIFAVGLHGRRAQDFARYCAEEGEGLRTFATWCALADDYGLPWKTWPAELHDPSSPAVAAYQEDHASALAFHSWLQWLLDRQLGMVQGRLREAGMAIGVIHDLAVGVHPEGADAWGLSAALASGVTVGAPPDQFNQLGQNWSQPPWRPDRLAELGYAPFRDMVRSVLRDSGGLRVDHIIGLFRLWWIPEGGSPAEGTYVRYDHEALIGILALEAHRAGAIVIGEDLGVVEPSTREYLLERGLLGTSILWFEWKEGQPLPPTDYRSLCLTSVTTHDLPPTAGYLALEHVALRERLGLLTRPAAEERALEEQSIEQVRAALTDRGLLAPDADNDDVIVALHAWIAQTPSRLLGVSLVDLVGDRRIVNQPGTDREYPNWCVALSGPDGTPITLEEAMAAPLADRLARALQSQ